MKQVAIIGTVGVPAKYGGFETLAENLLNERSSCDIQYTVYCSSKTYAQKSRKYKGATLRYIPLKANGIQSVLYDIIAILHAIRHSDTLLILGVSGCLILPIIRLFSKIKIIVNIDGLEHKRDKWSSAIRRFLKWSEKTAVRNADIIIADNKAIQDYVRNEYGMEAVLIAYGGDHVLCDTRNIAPLVFQRYNILPGTYCFGLCRIEPENNVHLILEAFAIAGKRLLFVGNWENSDYGHQLKEKYAITPNITLLDPIYDLPTLNVLRKNCLYYLHGHSAGGTNPSLVEAMFFGIPIISYDVAYNRETTENKAVYFTSVEQLSNILCCIDNLPTTIGPTMREIAERRYRWSIIAHQYEQLYQ